MDAYINPACHPYREDEEADGVGSLPPAIGGNDAEFENGVGEVVEEDEDSDRDDEGGREAGEVEEERLLCEDVRN